jgi:hypothetical protein
VNVRFAHAAISRRVGKMPGVNNNYYNIAPVTAGVAPEIRGRHRLSIGSSVAPGPHPAAGNIIIPNVGAQLIESPNRRQARRRCSDLTVPTMMNTPGNRTRYGRERDICLFIPGTPHQNKPSRIEFSTGPDRCCRCPASARRANPPDAAETPRCALAAVTRLPYVVAVSRHFPHLAAVSE